MPRSGRLRKFIREYDESPKAEKVSFIPPFIILVVEIILLEHAISIQKGYIIVLTVILLVISIVEIIIVSSEIHQHYQIDHLERDLTIRLDDFILEKKLKNVKEIVEEFIEQNPNYENSRNRVYSISCQIMETHTQELWEKTLNNRLKRFISSNSYKNVKDLVLDFIDKYPEYKKDPGKVYLVAACFMANGGEKPKRRLSFRNRKG